MNKAINDINTSISQGNDKMIEGQGQYLKLADAIQHSFKWISSVSTQNDYLARECCQFVINCRPYLINIAPSIRLEWLEVAERTSLILEQEIQSEIISEMASTNWFLGKNKKAIALYNKSLSLTRNRSDDRGIAGIYGGMGLAYTDLGEISLAIDYLQKALGMIHDNKMRSIYLPILGRCYYYKGNLVLAENSFKESLRLVIVCQFFCKSDRRSFQILYS